ncbi:MAG: hypothetical protein GY874_18495 [Desulfobacteraceae bacterium]|nr:hypothetical protein [Desulfobacteraceae bacterium]
MLLQNPIEISPEWIDAIGGIEALNIDPERIKTTREGIEISVKFTRPEKRAMKRKKQIPVSKWAERYRVLPGNARFSGLWRNSNFPYLAGIMDASFFPSVEETYICAVPQTGKTESVYTCLAYAADRRPGDVMILFPSETDAKDNAKDRLSPMFEDSPRLREYLTGYIDDMNNKKITLQHMIIYMAWSNSPGRLSNRPCRYTFADEVDKYPQTANKKESSPVDLLRKRLRTFEGMSKFWMTSSPSVETGPIWVAMTKEAHSTFDFWVCCPDCGTDQKMVFGDGDGHGIKWTEGERDPVVIEQTKNAWYQCAHCESKWDDGLRDLAVRSGGWRDREGTPLKTVLKNKKPSKIGFHLPAWLSPLVPLHKCAAAFLEGLKDKTKLKDFKNGFAAEPWTDIQVARTEDRILALKDDRPAGIVPGGGQVACLVAGVDTHGTDDTGRLDYEIRAIGYGVHPSTWAIVHGSVNSFDALAIVLWEADFRDVDGNQYFVHLTCIDAMGRRTPEVYDFCRAFQGRILPCKGEQRLQAPYTWSNQDFYPGTKRPMPGRIVLYKHDTNYFKNLLASRLEVNPDDPGAWRYNKDLTAEWARQMCAEGINPKTNLWENPNGKPNHAMDVAVLQLLAAEIRNVRLWPRPEDKARNRNKTPIVARSKFITGG